MSLVTVPCVDKDVLEEIWTELIQTRLLVAQLVALHTGERVRVSLPLRR